MPKRKLDRSKLGVSARAGKVSDAQLRWRVLSGTPSVARFNKRRGRMLMPHSRRFALQAMAAMNDRESIKVMIKP